MTMETLNIATGNTTLTTVTTAGWELLAHHQRDARPPFVPHDARVEGADDLVVSFWYDAFEVRAVWGRTARCTCANVPCTSQCNVTPSTCALAHQMVVMAAFAWVLPAVVAVVALWYRTQFVQPWEHEQTSLSLSDVLYMPWNLFYRVMPTDTALVCICLCLYVCVCGVCCVLCDVCV